MLAGFADLREFSPRRRVESACGPEMTPNRGIKKLRGDACSQLVTERMPEGRGPVRATLTLPIPSGYLARPLRQVVGTNIEVPGEREGSRVSDARASGGSAPHNDPENPRWSRG